MLVEVLRALRFQAVELILDHVRDGYVELAQVGASAAAAVARPNVRHFRRHRHPTVRYPRPRLVDTQVIVRVRVERAERGRDAREGLVPRELPRVPRPLNL